ncbi:hypothetical protein [Victivallis sp. Marseille-Q1083]|uniref:hypothetical protein n=1 Tax=Victivallis sp. Marseille-Q1083 TaxID=2717288 RepID=UPI0015883ED5|nr:hypothetical protein [Victivallis sp. Marseille-Q1083]
MLMVLFIFIVSLLVQAALFYVAVRLTGNPTPYKVLFQIALIGSLCALVPFIGFPISLIVVLFLLVNWGEMSWGAAILTVLLTYALAIAMLLVIGLITGVTFFGLSDTAATTTAVPAGIVLFR